MPVNKVYELKCDAFMLMYKRAVIDSLKQSKEGLEILRQAEVLNRTDCDMEGLRKIFGEEVRTKCLD